MAHRTFESPLTPEDFLKGLLSLLKGMNLKALNAFCKTFVRTFLQGLLEKNMSFPQKTFQKLYFYRKHFEKYISTVGSFKGHLPQPTFQRRRSFQFLFSKVNLSE